MELLVVVILIGIFSATAAMRFGRTLFAEFASQGVCRELSLALISCQRAAITSGDDHFLEFVSSGGQITHYRIMRDLAGTPTLVDGPKEISADVTVTTSHGTMRYNFQGSALQSYWVVVTGIDRVWRIDVVAITGTPRVTQSS